MRRLKLGMALGLMFVAVSGWGQKTVTFTAKDGTVRTITLAPLPEIVMPPMEAWTPERIATLRASAQKTQMSASSGMMLAMPDMESDGGSMALMSGGEGGASPSLLLYTNGDEEVLFDTTNSSGNALLASWRDVRTSPAPTGNALGLLIATNCPFELTTVIAEVVLENPEALANTEFEAGFFRNTNALAVGLYADPEYLVSDVNGTMGKTLTDLGNGHWRLSVQLPEYGWGTNRVFVLRTVPIDDGLMTKLNFVACGDTIPGVTAYASDNTTSNMVQVALPKMQIKRRMIAPTRTPTITTNLTTWDMEVVPGYQLGTATNLSEGLTWTTDFERVWRTDVTITNGTGFFLSRPDITQ